MFQFTPPRKGRQCIIDEAYKAILVSIHAPTQGATMPRECRCRCVYLFQFTPPRKGRRYIVHRNDSGVLFQFTPPRKGRQHIDSKRTRCRNVSIHAPTQGATFVLCRFIVPPIKFQFTPPRKGRPDSGVLTLRGITVSIHAPTQGATAFGQQQCSADLRFNSRPHARGDTGLKIKCRSFEVSIHAPTQGATVQNPCQPCRVVFQFTPPRKGRRFSCRDADIQSCFNSRPHARGDKINVSQLFACISFNSRPHARGDSTTMKKQEAKNVSIHAPTQGATVSRAFVVTVKKFQFTPPRKGRLLCRLTVGTARKFQFTPPRKGRLSPSQSLFCGDKFQFTPPRKGRPSSFSVPPKLFCFNSRPHARGDKRRNTL